MAIKLSDNILIRTTAPADAKWGPYSGPTLHDALEVALVYLLPSYRYEGLSIGVKVGDNPIIEYWFRGGISDENLIRKATEGGSSTFTTTVPTHIGIGGILGGSSFFDSETELVLNKMFYPNYGKRFPNSPIFLGVTNEVPRVNTILGSSHVTTYDDLVFHQYLDNGYLMISLPGYYYLNRIIDENGTNIVDSFDVIYKSIQTDNISDIYNVYVSPKLNYKSNVNFSFSTITGTPVQSFVQSGVFHVNNVDAAILNYNVSAGEYANIKQVFIRNAEVDADLLSLSITEGVKSVLKQIYLTNAHVNSMVKSLSINEGQKSILKNISVTNANVNARLNTFTLKEGTKVKLNGTNVISGTKSTINNISIQNIESAVINNVNIFELPTANINRITIQNPYATLGGIVINEGIKAKIENLVVTKGTKSTINSANVSEISQAKINNITIKNPYATLGRLSINEGIKSVINTVNISKGVKSNISSMNVSEISQAKINSITIKNPHSILNGLNVSQGTKATINEITIGNYTYLKGITVSKGIKVLLSSVHVKSFLE